MRRYVSSKRGKGESFVARPDDKYREKAVEANLENIERAKTWNATRAPADPWEAIKPLEKKRATD